MMEKAGSGRAGISLPPIKNDKNNRRESSYRKRPGQSTEDEIRGPIADDMQNQDRHDIIRKTLGMTVPDSEIEEIDITARRLSRVDPNWASMPMDNPRQGLSLWDRIDRNSKSPIPSNASEAENDNMDSVSSYKLYPEEGEAGGQAEVEGAKPPRFRVLARMVKNNLAWAKDLRDKHEDGITKFVVKSKNAAKGEEEEEEALVFDLSQFRFQQKSYGGLTTRARRILHKHPLERTQEDVIVLKDVVDRLKCFKKYPRKVKHELSRVITYEHYPDGRVIIQQGHLGFSFYFILTGKVAVYLDEKDKSGGTHAQVIGELSEGSSFGELALLHDIKRTATIVCKGRTCEFLRVDKTDFETVLRQYYASEWTERFQMLHNLPFFQDWKIDQIQQCNYMAKTKEFIGGSVIYCGWKDLDDHVYFVKSGECQVIREIYLVKHHTPYKGQYFSLPTPDQMDFLKTSRRNRKRRSTITFLYEKRYWQICTLKRGFYFGTGENLKDAFVVANDRVEVVVLPRILFARFGQSKQLERMRDDLNAALPTNEDAFERFMMSERWKSYKRQVVSEVIRQRSSSHASLEDVPQVYRQAAWRSANHRMLSLPHLGPTNRPPFH